MLSLALKNGIIMILIILILHFLIKNYLVDHRPQPQQQPQPFATSSKPAIMEAITEPIVDMHIDFSSDVSKDVEPQNKASPQTDIDSDDLLNYVKSLTEGDPPKLVDDSCEIKLDPGYTNSSIKRGNPVKDPSGVVSQYYTINEYDDENVMNGGRIFSNIEGYEHNDMFCSFENLN